MKEIPLGIPYYGPVYINSGKYQGRIGYYDGEEYDSEDQVDKAVVLFGDGFTSSEFHLIAYEDISEINSQVLLDRRESLLSAIYLKQENGQKITQKTRMSYLEELNYINSLLTDRMYEAMFSHNEKSTKIFLSHSSLDKPFVMPFAVDLKSHGFDVWLDTWEIHAGESIPTKISTGIEESDFLVLILSPNAVSSKWVEQEWQAKYWEELEKGKIKLIPVLIHDCEIPTLLKTKKYIDFTTDYSKGLEEMCFNLIKLQNV